MMLTGTSASGLSAKCSRGQSFKAGVSRPTVRCASSSSTWDAWTVYMEKIRKGAKVPRPSESIFTDLASEMGKASRTYHSRFGGGTAGPGAAAPVANAPSRPAVSSTLQRKLAQLGASKLQEVVGSSVNSATTTYTTTELGAGLSTTGTIVEKNGEKKAVVVFIATDAARDVSWSRLEGLILHWAASDRSGGAWSTPPDGWSAIPNKGGPSGSSSYDSSFEKAAIEGEVGQAYVLTLELPLRGTLRSGGVTYVLKATAGQNTRWLKDAAVDRDFYLDLQSLPVVR